MLVEDLTQRLRLARLRAGTEAAETAPVEKPVPKKQVKAAGALTPK